MRSEASQQWLYLVECGAEVCTPPRLCMSSWASMDWPDRPQQLLSTRATSPWTDEFPLARLFAPAESSLYTWAMPQYTLASIQSRYLPSDRVNPWERSSLMVLLMLSSPVAVSCTSRTERLQLLSVTKRTWRTPPVSPALWLKTASTAPAHCRMFPASDEYRSVTSAAWA